MKRHDHYCSECYRHLSCKREEHLLPRSTPTQEANIGEDFICPECIKDLPFTKGVMKQLQLYLEITGTDKYLTIKQVERIVNG